MRGTDALSKGLYDVTDFLQIIEASITAAGKQFSEKLIEKSSKKVRQAVLEVHHDLVGEPRAISKALLAHKESRKEWTEKIFHHGMHESVSLSDVYVSVSAGTDINEHSFGNNANAKPLDEILQSQGHLVLIGELGSGKTTCLKAYAKQIWGDTSSKPLIFLRFRDFLETDDLLSVCMRTLDVEAREAKLTQEQKEKFSESKFEAALLKSLSVLFDKMSLTILLDGLDEAPVSIRHTIQEQIDILSQHMNTGRILVTTRPAILDRAARSLSHFQLQPLSEKSARDLAKKWLGKGRLSKVVKEFELELSDKPYANLALRPLMLTNLCIIYAKYKSLPVQPISIYRKIVSLCIEEWDAQRGIKRESNYASLDNYRKADFLASFAFSLRAEDVSGMSFHRELAEKIYRSIAGKFDLPRTEFTQVAKDMEATTGLFTRVSYDRFEFSHKSLSEFLVADYIVRSGTNDETRDVLSSSPNEAAIAISLSTNPDRWLLNLLFNNDKRTFYTFRKAWIDAFLDRILQEQPSILPERTLATSTIWLARQIYKEPELTVLRRFLEWRKVEKALTIYFSDLSNYEHDGDSIQLRLAPQRTDSDVIVGARFREFANLFSRFMD